MFGEERLFTSKIGKFTMLFEKSRAEGHKK
jgi:hypothetical protein